MVATVDEALALKSAGNGLFRSGDYQQALDLFAQALDRLPPDDCAQRSTLFCNRAIAYNRLKLYSEAEHEATAAIAANPLNAKAFYHRMLSRRHLNDTAGFRADFDAYSKLKNFADDGPDPGYLACIDAAVAQAVGSVAPGDEVVLIGAVWWKRFRAFYNSDTLVAPGPIDNHRLVADAADGGMKSADDDGDARSKTDDVVVVVLPPFDNGVVLRADLRKDDDYVVVPDNVWKALREQFGGGPEIRRPVRDVGGDVQLRAVTLCVQRIDEGDLRVAVVCSPTNRIGDVVRALCALWTAAASELRVVRRVAGNAFELVHNKLRLLDVGLADGCTMLVERRSATGIWPCAQVVGPAAGECDICSACFDRIPADAVRIGCDTCDRVRYCSPRCRQSHSRWHERLDHIQGDGRSRTPGATGLMNIGNTCYINAALQCLSGMHELTRVFLSGDFAAELNRDNPLGCQGRLAEAYADLLRDIWFSDSACADPREFKRAVSCFATQFAGCQQQDAQEFLAFLLDGLHEDLNRIRTKPYVPVAESAGRPDEVVAREQWSAYLARDQSVVVDCLLGQFKSELVCGSGAACPPSVTFDPFLYVSLPLPEPARLVPVLYVPVSGQVPTQLHIKVERLTAISLEAGVRALLANRPDFAPDNQLVCAVITNSRPLQLLPKTGTPLEVTPSQELAVFECRARHVPVSCIIRQIPSGVRDTSVLFRGRPFVVDFSLDLCPRLSGADVYARLVQYLRRSLYQPLADPSFWVEMFCNSERVVIAPTDEAVDIRYHTRAVLVVTWKTDDILRDVDMNELQRVERGPEGAAMAPSVTPTTTIYDCFKAFTKTEALGVDDWECASCHRKGDVSKRMSFWRLPDVLVLHLKRFDSVRRHALFGEAANKISKEVQFPLKDLDLSPFMSTKEAERSTPRYELFGVINHFGASFFGHYTAFTKGLDGFWRHFDDDTVKVVPPNEICQSNAYLLFYRRQQE